MNRNQESRGKTLGPYSGVDEHLSYGEKSELRRLVNGLPESARIAGQQPELFWDQQLFSIHQQIEKVTARRTTPLRFAWMAALGLVLFASFLLKTGSRLPVQPKRSTSDRELLVQVEQALDGDVPQALQPASLIAHEIGQSAELSSKPTISKEKNGNEN